MVGLTAAPKHVTQEPVAAAHPSVQIVNFAFAPAIITVTVGDTITWTNQDAAPHTVTTSSGPQPLNSPNLSTGQSWTFTFTAPGTYPYYCAVHPDMHGEVVVRAAPVTTPPSTQAHPSTPTKSSQSAHAAPPTTTVRTAQATPSVSTSASSAAPASAPAPASALTDTETTPAAITAANTSSTSPLSPPLLLGGLTAAVAVFCLLLVASRSSAAHRASQTEHPDDSK
jgi:amicyanin